MAGRPRPPCRAAAGSSFADRVGPPARAATAGGATRAHSRPLHLRESRRVHLALALPQGRPRSRGARTTGECAASGERLAVARCRAFCHPRQRRRWAGSRIAAEAVRRAREGADQQARRPALAAEVPAHSRRLAAAGSAAGSGRSSQEVGARRLRTRATPACLVEALAAGWRSGGASPDGGRSLPERERAPTRKLRSKGRRTPTKQRCSSGRARPTYPAGFQRRRRRRVRLVGAGCILEDLAK